MIAQDVANRNDLSGGQCEVMITQNVLKHKIFPQQNNGDREHGEIGETPYQKPQAKTLASTARGF